jgi:hypothetical protein
MAFEVTQPPLNITSRNLPGGKCGRRVRLKTAVPSLGRLYGKNGNLEVPQHYRYQRPVIEIALYFSNNNNNNNNNNNRNILIKIRIHIEKYRDRNRIEVIQV